MTDGEVCFSSSVLYYEVLIRKSTVFFYAFLCRGNMSQVHWLIIYWESVL